MKKIIFTICSLFIFTNLFSQSDLFVDTSYTVEEMVMDFFDNTVVTPSNITSTGAIAFFDAGGTNLPINNGLLLTTGVLLEVADSSNASGTTTGQLGIQGDDDLTMLTADGNSYDASIIEFDFMVSESDTLDFNYSFGSEEYLEFTCSSFNDVFAFFVSGPGIEGPYSNDAINISTIPNLDIPVSINNLHGEVEGCPAENEEYYIYNEGTDHIMYDGLTTSLPASFYAEAGNTYHVKIAIGDVSDSAFDSGVFLGVNSLGSIDSFPPPTDFDFSLFANSVSFDNLSKYARTWHWDFGNEVTSDERHPEPVTYDTPGEYTVSLTTTNHCCTNYYETTISVGVASPLSVSTETTNNPLACFGDNNAGIDFEITGGLEPYTTVWTPFIDDFSTLSAGTYTYVVTDADGETFSDEIVISEPNELETETSSFPDVNNESTGTAIVNATGGISPYTYLWSNGGITESIENISFGTYTVTVTDANNCEIMTEVEVDLQTGVNDLTNDLHLEVYPNPATSELFVTINDDILVKSISLINSLGQSINQDFQIQSKAIAIELNESLSTGLYFVQIELEDGRRATTKFMKR